MTERTRARSQRHPAKMAASSSVLPSGCLAVWPDMRQVGCNGGKFDFAEKNQTDLTIAQSQEKHTVHIQAVEALHSKKEDV